MGIELIPVRAKVEAYDGKLRSDDPRFLCSVALQHRDGSFFFIRHAFAVLVDQEWVAVFTEHHRTFVYHEDEVKVQTVEHSLDPLDLG